MLTTKIALGVKDYKIIIPNACGYEQECACDDIKNTVDYDQVCQILVNNLTTQKNLHINNLKLAINQFCSNINTGLLELEVQCPHIYLKDQCLL